MKSAKISELIGSLFMLVIGSMLNFFIMLITLNPQRNTSDGEFVWFVFGAFAALWVHVLFVYLRKTLNVDSQKLTQFPTREGSIPHVAQQIGRFDAFYTSFFLGFVTIVLVMFGVPFLIHFFNQTGFVITTSFIFYVIGVVVYGIILGPVFVFVGRKLGKMAEGNLWLVSIENNTFVISIKMKYFFTPVEKRRPYVFRISFDEIEEVRLLTYVEAKVFESYTIGPDLSFAAASVRDQYKYAKGEIDRPNYMFASGVTYNYSLFLRGENLLYLIPIQSANNAEILERFNAYKQSKVV